MGSQTSWFAGLCTSVSSSARFSSGRAFESSWVSAGIDSDQSWRLHHLVLPVQPMESIVQWRTIWINLNIICCVIFAACLFRNGCMWPNSQILLKTLPGLLTWWHDNPPLAWHDKPEALDCHIVAAGNSAHTLVRSPARLSSPMCNVDVLWANMGKMICGVRVQNHNVLRVCQLLQAEDKTHQTIKEYARAWHGRSSSRRLRLCILC